jgi:3-deoxy-D-manno-octulosonic-acid transferase
MSKIYLIIYNIFFILFLPLIVLVIFLKKNVKEFFYKLSERVACYNSLNKKSKKNTIWIHCASFGEVRAVEPILCELKDYYVVLTSITKSGREYAQKLQNVDFVALLPLDIYPLMYKAFNIINPDMLILVETELWMNMLYIASSKNVKIVTINGRISEKSFRAYKKLKFFMCKFIELINVIIAISKYDADRFRFLTNGKSNIMISGNIKYDGNFKLSSDCKDFLIRKDDFIFTAGSTRTGEEEIIADIYNKIIINFDKIKFFLAPRHLSRISKIIEILEIKGISYSLFSSGNLSAGFILVDVFGKLQDIYSISDVCYVGASLVNKGGQNPIEPAACGKPVLFGKYMDNFKIEADTLVRSNGAFVVRDEVELYNTVKRFIFNRHLIAKMGKNAFNAVQCKKGVVSFTVEKIKENLNV